LLNTGTQFTPWRHFKRISRTVEVIRDVFVASELTADLISAEMATDWIFVFSLLPICELGSFELHSFDDGSNSASSQVSARYEIFV